MKSSPYRACLNRRTFVQAATGGLLTATYSMPAAFAAATLGNLGIPGPFPGRVIAVEHPGSIVDRRFQREPIRQMLNKGMMALTGAPSPVDAWRSFFEPSDVVGLKLNPVGRPAVISSPETVQEIIAGIRSAGVPAKNIVAYERYRDELIAAGFDKWLPEGVRWTWATATPSALQLDMDRYDRDQFVEMPLVMPSGDPSNAHHRRSYLSNFISKDVNKVVNLGVIKHHQSAGVTISLKNMSHGFVNNVARSHSSITLNTCGTFIPNIVDHPIIRKKVVLHIADGILGGYHGGPGRTVQKYLFELKTMYFATDPVALDKTGWKAIDAQRVKMGMQPVAVAKPDADSLFLNMQVEHIEIAGVMGLGVFDDNKIDVRRFKLG
jgi:uncharacterized protein (DUF362 family)